VALGKLLGCELGPLEGNELGITLGKALGKLDGVALGKLLGCKLGTLEGNELGCTLGIIVGAILGCELGSSANSQSGSSTTPHIPATTLSDLIASLRSTNDGLRPFNNARRSSVKLTRIRIRSGVASGSPGELTISTVTNSYIPSSAKIFDTAVKSSSSNAVNSGLFERRLSIKGRGAAKPTVLA